MMNLFLGSDGLSVRDSHQDIVCKITGEAVTPRRNGFDVQRPVLKRGKGTSRRSLDDNAKIAECASDKLSWRIITQFYVFVVG